MVMSPRVGWQRLRDMQHVLAEQPTVAHAVHCLPLADMLELQLELLCQPAWPYFDQTEPLPSNIIRFRPRRQRQ
jgi:hypothetical protein